MRLWIDNTSLHSVSRTLTGHARGEEDVSGLFQFATQLVFSDTIELGCTSSDPIRSTTATICDRLGATGVSPAILRVWDPAENQLAAAAERAAERLAFEIDSPLSASTTLTAAAIATARPDFADSNSSGDDAVVSLLTSLPSTDRPVPTDHHLERGLSGVPLYMLAISDSLWSAVNTVASHSPWTQASAWSLAIYLRCYFNQELATGISEGTGVFVDYSPSVSRSRIVHLHTGQILETLIKMTDDAARIHNTTMTSGSSIAKTLATRGRYEPAGILSEALRLRERAAPLRRYLHSVLQTRDIDQDYADILRTVDQLRLTLDRDLRRQRTDVSESSLRWQMICFVPVPVPEPMNVLKWLGFAATRKRVAVLSEFARHGANPRLGENIYGRVERNAARFAS